MPKIRIGILNRARDTYPGGDLVHLDELTIALADLGIERTYAGSEQDLSCYDILHIHHVNFPWSRDNFMAAFRSGKPFVVTTIFYNSEAWGMTYRDIQNWLNQADRVVTFSATEEIELRELTRFTKHIDRIPPGVGTTFIDETDPKDRTGVLTVAAREGDKNCDLVEEICGELDIPYHQAIGVTRLRLPIEYKKAKLFVNASGSERFGLTILEGLAAGCRVLATKYSRGLEWLPGIMPIDPMNRRSLKEMIEYAYNHIEWNFEPNRIARSMSWSIAAIRWANIYREVLSVRRDNKQGQSRSVTSVS